MSANDFAILALISSIVVILLSVMLLLREQRRGGGRSLDRTDGLQKLHRSHVG
jgi:hypothetical protein